MREHDQCRSIIREFDYGICGPGGGDLANLTGGILVIEQNPSANNGSTGPDQAENYGQNGFRLRLQSRENPASNRSTLYSTRVEKSLSIL